MSGAVAIQNVDVSANENDPRFATFSVQVITNTSDAGIAGTIAVTVDALEETFSFPFSATTDSDGLFELTIPRVPFGQWSGSGSVALAVVDPFDDGSEVSVQIPGSDDIPGWVFVEGVSVSPSSGGELELVVDGQVRSYTQGTIGMSLVADVGGEQFELTAEAEGGGGTFELPMTIPAPDEDTEGSVTAAITSPFNSQSTYPHFEEQPPLVFPGTGGGGDPDPDPPDTDVEVDISAQSPEPGRVIAQMTLSNPSSIPEVGDLVWWVEDASGSELHRDSMSAPAPPGSATFPADITGLPAGDLNVCAEFRPN
jgi:hypothetical protein